MDNKDLETLQENYESIGPLTVEQYLAVKTLLGQRMIYAKEIEMDRIRRLDSNGQETFVSPDEIQPGDTIRITATIRNMAGGVEKTGNITIEDIKGAEFDPETGRLLIESDKFSIANFECSREIQTLREIIKDPNNWVTKETLSEMIPSSITWEKFKEISDQYEKEKYREAQDNRADLDLNDFFNNTEDHEFK